MFLRLSANDAFCIPAPHRFESVKGSAGVMRSSMCFQPLAQWALLSMQGSTEAVALRVAAEAAATGRHRHRSAG